MKKVSVVILNWNGELLLREFLPSVVANTNQELADIIVADNGSSDNSITILESEFPEVGIIKLEENLGFAEGYNRALKHINTEYSILLNSDVAVTPHWIEPLIGYMDNHPQTAACQPKIRSFRHPEYFEHAGACGGYIDHLGYPFCRGRLFHHLEKDNKQHDSITPIFWATGACLFVRTKTFYEVGGLDATFFAHMEEIDLCWRLKSRGYELVCIPQSTVFHLGAATLSNESPHKTYLNFRNNLFMLYKNLPERDLHRVMTTRLILDSAAFFSTLLSGKTENAKAIFKAVRSFYQNKSLYTEKRKENLALSKCTQFSEMYSGSIIFDFFVKRKKQITL